MNKKLEKKAWKLRKKYHKNKTDFNYGMWQGFLKAIKFKGN